MIKSIYPFVQLAISLLLVTLILLQARGTGLGATFGGGGEFYRSKRGAEKILFHLTIALAIGFFLFSLFGVVIY